MNETPFLDFENILNPRDLGGILTKDGRTVRSGALLRSAHLAEATDADMLKLQDMDIRLVVDLRSEGEVGGARDRDLPGAEHVNIEIIPLNAFLFEGMGECFRRERSFEKGMAHFVQTPAAKMISEGFYLSFVSDPDCQAAFASALRKIIDAGCPNVLWHCSQGKDRTGLLAAYILAALGVDMPAILQDFAMSNVSYAEQMARIKAMAIGLGGGRAECFCVNVLVGVDVEAFWDAMELIRTDFGGMDAFLRNNMKLTEADFTALREAYLQ